MAEHSTCRKDSVHTAFVQTRLDRLKRRADFLRVANARKKWATHGLILQVAPLEAGATDPKTGHPSGTNAPQGRVGFTASKKVGGAVQRNRAKRRLRAIADDILPQEASRHCDYVLIGRTETVNRPFEALKNDLRYALKKLKATRKKGTPQ